MENKNEKKPLVTTITGLPENTEAALTYVLGWVSGLFFLLLEKKNKKIRFHAMQSLVVFGFVNLAVMVPFIGWILSPVIGLAAFVLWLVLIVKAYQGEDFELPIAGEFAKKQIK